MKQMRNLLVAMAASVVLISGVNSMRAFADESMNQVGLNADQKQRVVGYLQDRIARHSHMTSAQIVADLGKSAARNRALFAKNGGNVTSFDKAVAQSIDLVKSVGDKDLVVAQEKAQLQRLMVSGNFVFFLTRSLWERGYDMATGKDDEGNFSGMDDFSPMGCTMISILYIPIDIVLLPFEFIASAVTGF